MTQIHSINPATEELVASYRLMTDAEATTVVKAVDREFRSWRKTPFSRRRSLLSSLATLLKEQKEELGQIMTSEMGKLPKEAISEVEKCAWVCEYYADKGESFLQTEEIATDMTRSFISYQPIGVVLAVMPWNFPFWQVFRFLAPALMAGNVGVLKHSSSVSGCAVAIERLVQEAGFPGDCFRTLLISSKQVEKIIENPAVRAVTLTGSVPAGAAVAEIAGKNLKKTVLELGGSDPYLILADADLKLAAAKCAQSRLLNAGQSCIAAKRFLVVEEVYDSFLEAFKKEMASLEVAPQASVELRDELHKQVQDSIKKGAKCLLGGEVPQGKGAFYPATILTEVASGMPAYDEELFGPVASVIKVKDLQEAVAVANDSEFGLGAGVFTGDEEEGLRIATELIDTGFCAINDFVKSDPRLPFGGVKKSGYGRELSFLGIREFVNIKTVTLA